MREIKFRVFADGKFYYFDDILEFGYVNTLAKIGRFSINKDYPVFQYTGLKDKNDVEIYEGDILRWWWDSEESGYGPGGICGKILQEKPVLVEFDYGGFGFITKLDWRFLGSPFEEECVEIIGNIFENPKLL